ncbi:hypothetical protein [Yeosuana marina]|uniref:hypothetical protein n=1 Tax=Yeosuana marina TaxID=1565536 RepID=UPI001420EAD2|nr:hypothetical protein [Yeosuana marina]
MKKTLQILILLIFGLNLSAQNVKINSKIQVDSTELDITQSDFKFYGYSTFDNKKTDSLIVSISSIGTSSTAIRIDLTKKPRAFITLSSDVPEYDGKHILDIEFEFYDLELNATEFKIGDRIMGKIKGKSKIIPNNSDGYQIEFKGEFSHIIGKLIMKNTAEQSYRIIQNE